MARIRSIKPEFFTSGQVVECSTNARLLFVGSWVFCDDKGRHPLSFKRLKMEVYPGDDFTNDEIEAMFTELWAVGLVTVYQVGAERFFCVNGWGHQKIDRPQPPKYPAPSDGSVIPFVGVGDLRIDEHSTNDRRTFATDGKGYDGIGGDKINTCVAERHVNENGDVEWNDTEQDASPPVANGKPRKPSPYSPEFEEFWQAYPPYRRTAKGTAWKAWQKATKDTTPAELIDKAEEYAESPKGKGEFSVMPATWLNGRCWEDDPTAWGSAPKKVCRVPSAAELTDYNPYAKD